MVVHGLMCTSCQCFILLLFLTDDGCNVSHKCSNVSTMAASKQTSWMYKKWMVYLRWFPLIPMKVAQLHVKQQQQKHGRDPQFPAILGQYSMCIRGLQCIWNFLWLCRLTSCSPKWRLNNWIIQVRLSKYYWMVQILIISWTIWTWVF